MSKFNIKGYVVIVKGNEILISKIPISEKAMNNLPFKRDWFNFYKQFVTDTKVFKTRGKNIDEKFLKAFLRRQGY